MRRAGRWLRTPKGLTVAALTLLAAVEVPGRGWAAAVVLVPAGVGAVVDAGLTRYLAGRWQNPDGGLITGLLVGLVIDPGAPLYASALAVAVGITLKHLVRTRWSNVFNPAAAGLVVAYFLGGSMQSWWGGLGDLPALFVGLLLLVGGFIAERENKLPAVLAFASVYVSGLTAVALSDPASVAGAFRVPDLNAALFFALFMVTDPPTSPVRYEHQAAYGAIIGVAALAALLLGAGVLHFPIAILVANLAEAWRRSRLRAPGSARPAAPADATGQ